MIATARLTQWIAFESLNFGYTYSMSGGALGGLDVTHGSSYLPCNVAFEFLKPFNKTIKECYRSVIYQFSA